MLNHVSSMSTENEEVTAEQYQAAREAGYVQERGFQIHKGDESQITDEQIAEIQEEVEPYRAQVGRRDARMGEIRDAFLEIKSDEAQ